MNEAGCKATSKELIAGGLGPNQVIWACSIHVPVRNALLIKRQFTVTRLLSGRCRVIDFYKTSCGACRYIQPGFVKLCRASTKDPSVMFFKHNVMDECAPSPVMRCYLVLSRKAVRCYGKSQAAIYTASVLLDHHCM